MIDQTNLHLIIGLALLGGGVVECAVFFVLAGRASATPALRLAVLGAAGMSFVVGGGLVAYSFWSTGPVTG